MWDWQDGIGWGMAFGVVLCILFWGTIIALIIWGISKATNRGKANGRRKPLDLAKERYAKGEISKEEFDNIKKDLS